MYLSVQEETDSIDAVYSYKGRVCPYLIPNGKEVKELESLALIRNDLNCALESFKHIEYLTSNSGSDLVKRSLLFAGIISYAKPFSEGRGRIVRLKKRDVFKSNNEFEIVHNQLIKIRNKYVAHGDKSSFESAIIRVALSPEPEERKVIDLYHIVLSTSGLSPEIITNYINTTNAALKFVHEKISYLNAHVITEAKKEDIDYLYDNAYHHE